VNGKVDELFDKAVIPEEVAEENEYVRKFLEKLSTGKVIGIYEDITFEEFKAGLLKWKERTTTSPSGRHLGHYKIMMSLNVSDKTNTNVNL
jgi:hypothetical protein